MILSLTDQEKDELGRSLSLLNDLYYDSRETFDSYLMKYFSSLEISFKADTSFMYLFPEFVQSTNGVEYVFHRDGNLQRGFGSIDLLGVNLLSLSSEYQVTHYFSNHEIHNEKFNINRKGTVTLRPLVFQGKMIGGFGVFANELAPSWKNELIFTQFFNVLAMAMNDYHHYEHVKRLQHVSDVYKIALDKTCYILFTDRKGVMTYANDLFLKLLNTTNNEVYGKNFEFFLGKQKNDSSFKDILSLSANGHVWSGEFCVRDGQTKDHWLMTTVIPHKENDGKVTQLVFISYDVTKQKMAQEEVIKAKNMALEAAQAKSFFLSNMSHEIRTPLNAIVGIVDIFGEDQLSLEQRRNISILRNASANLLSIVNDILDYSKIESQMMDIVDADFILRESVEEPCLLHSQQANKNKVQLYCDIDNEADFVVTGDRVRLEQVLSNLISNAIKFTHDGKICVNVKKNIGSHKGNVVFEVKDSGEGMEVKDMEKLFKPFSQLESDMAKKAKGTGLGLAICKKLVELMGGEIWIDSVKGVGTSVFFTIDFKKLQPIPNNVLDVKNIESDQDVLIVLSDDIKLTAILNSFLDGCSVKKIFFSNFISLIEWLDFSMQNEKVSLVLDVACLTDIPIDMMKDVVAKYHQIKKTIILNTHCVKEIEFASKEASFAHLYSSPLLKNEFVSVLKGQVAKVNFSNASYDVESDLNLKILLVDDVEDNRTLIKAYLKKYNCEIVEADSGMKAIELFKQHQFDVVLMDIQMPEVDGVFATKQLRAYEQSLGLTPVVIVALTAFVQEEERTLFLKAGCNFHLSKPIKKNVLIKSLESIVKSKKVSVA